MKNNLYSIAAAFFLCFAALSALHAQGTAFTYQGRLANNGSPASGNFDFQFNLFADAGGTQPVGSAFSTNNLPVSAGLFTTTVNFGAGIFTGSNYFLQVSVRTNTGGTGTFTALTPLQPVTAVPYAIMANSASNLLGQLPVGQLSGTLNNTQLANNSITVNPGTGLSGGGAVALGGTTTLNNTGVLSVTGGSSDITANTVGGVVTLGSDATSAATANTIVKRDGTGSFSAGAITATSFSGNGLALTDLNASLLISIGNNFPATGNFFVGSAGNNGTTGQFNTGLGPNALQDITSGSNNTAYGFDTLHVNTTGSDNTANGFGALSAITSGSNNIALGFQAGSQLSLGKESGNIDIGNVGVTGDTNIIRIGSTQTNTFIAGAITGNGAGLTNLNASQITGGPLVVSNLSLSSGNQIAPLSVPPKIPVSAIGTLAITDSSKSLAVAGNYAYVGSSISSSSGAIQIFDLSDPTHPLLAASVAANASVTSVAVAGRYAYAAEQDQGGAKNGMQVFDVSDPANPVSIGNALALSPTASRIQSVAVEGRFLYSVDSEVGFLTAYDAGEPNAPRLVGQASPGAGSPSPFFVAVAGGFAYVANSASNSLAIFDVRNPSSIALVGSASTGQFPMSVAVAGRYAYVVNQTDGNLQIFDARNPAGPVLAGSINAGSAPSFVAVAGRYAVVASKGNPNVLIFDVSNPASPQSAGAIEISDVPVSVAVAGRYLYVLASGSLDIFDMGGAYIQQFEAGSTVTGNLQTRDTATIGNNLDVRGGLTISGSARVSGGLSVDTGSISATNFIGNAANLTSLNAQQLTGPVPSASLTSVPAASLTGTATLPAAVLPSTVALLNANQTFTATNTFAASVGIATTSTPQALLEIQGGADNTGANDQHDISLEYRNGGYRHWIRSRHNTAVVDNAIDFFVNTNNSSTASSAPGIGNVLVMSLNGGNVGIANAEPTHLLVVGSAGSPAFCDGTTWQNGSDRNSKESFSAIDARTVLEKVSALPITEWKYKVEADGTKHIGPMAQDFHAAFGLNGGDDKHIATIDEEGVALAAIQGLNEKLEEQAKAKDAEIAELKTRLDRLEQTLKKRD